MNILDAPGYFDFVGEAEEAAAAADAAVIVVNGKNGVEVGTLKAWALCEKYSLPRMIFITNMDFDNASFRKITEDLTEQFGKKIAPIHFQMCIRDRYYSPLLWSEHSDPESSAAVSRPHFPAPVH